eukprot:796783-Pelagomonas_calceolata.AAC.2
MQQEARHYVSKNVHSCNVGQRSWVHQLPGRQPLHCIDRAIARKNRRPHPQTSHAHFSTANTEQVTEVLRKVSQGRGLNQKAKQSKSLRREIKAHG